MFQLHSDYAPTGDQPQAIQKLTEGLEKGMKHQVLLGVTGSGKTFTMANIIKNANRPALIIAHNKTLAAQLAAEFREFFPENAVGYFVSYYDYYQPEAYIPSTDTFIEKDSSINDEIDRMRHSATSWLAERRDVVIVASVSCIYGLGDPEEYEGLSVSLREGQELDRDELIRQLIDIQFTRNDFESERGSFRVRGEVIEIIPAASEKRAVRVEYFGDEIERISEVDTVTGKVLRYMNHVLIFPASHYATSKDKLDRCIAQIEEDLEARLKDFRDNDRLLEAQRLEQRVHYDIEMMREIGYCSGIENYSRYFDGRQPGEAPFTLLDYFPKDFLIFIDEAHVTVPQIRAMYNGDYARKRTLVDYGFRLPAAYDNRPLKFHEFEERAGQTIYVSATPGPYELERAEQVVEQIIRPTGLIDPEIVVRPATGQVDDLLGEIHKVTEAGGRVLVTTLTKRMAESLTQYLKEMDVRVEYLHSDIETLERIKLIHGLRSGEFDVLVGINLLREGLDGLFAQRDQPDPDHRPRRAQRRRPGDHVRRRDHRLHAAGHLRDQPPPGDPAGLQRGTPHRAQDHPQRHPGADGGRPQAGCLRRRRAGRRGKAHGHRAPGGADAPGRQQPRLRKGRQVPRRNAGAEGREGNDLRRTVEAETPSA